MGNESLELILGNILNKKEEKLKEAEAEIAKINFTEDEKAIINMEKYRENLMWKLLADDSVFWDSINDKVHFSVKDMGLIFNGTTYLYQHTLQDSPVLRINFRRRLNAGDLKKSAEKFGYNARIVMPVPWAKEIGFYENQNYVFGFVCTVGTGNRDNDSIDLLANELNKESVKFRVLSDYLDTHYAGLKGFFHKICNR